KKRRSLDVWIVIRTASGRTEKLDSQIFQFLKEKKRLLHIGIYPTFLSAESIAIRIVLGRNTSFLRAFLKRHPVENAHPNTNLQARSRCSNTGNDRSQKPCSALETPSIFSFPI